MHEDAHEDVQVHVQLLGCLCLLDDLDGDPLACILYSTATGDRATEHTSWSESLRA